MRVIVNIMLMLIDEIQKQRNYDVFSKYTNLVYLYNTRLHE